METSIGYVDGCGLIELEIPNDIVTLCYHSGECMYDVENCIIEPTIRKQFDEISDELLIKSLSEVWDDVEPIENADRHTNECRALWIACGNIIEENPELLDN